VEKLAYDPPELASDSLGPHEPRSARALLGDETLLLRHEAGDPRAFDELFRRYRQPLFHFILRFLRDESASQDAVQDVFLKVLRHPGSFEARSRFSTWLHAIARNLCLDMLRKRRLRNHPSLDQQLPNESGEASGPPLVERLRADGPPPDEDAARGPLRLKLLVAIRAIPPEQRQVFLLREVAGLCFQEIAQESRISVNTAKSRMRYALGNLRRALDAQGVDADAL